MAISFRDLRVDVDQLILDSNNYRLMREGEPSSLSDEEIFYRQTETQSLLEKESLDELRSSIRNNGFLEVDRVVVRKLMYAKKDLYLVIEGNRRVSALKGLVEDFYDGDETIENSLISQSKGIGVICLEGTEEEINNYSSVLMGIRHVSGPKKWAGFQSAKLVNNMKEYGKTFSEIASSLGIRESDAIRRYKGFHAYKQMEHDEKYGGKVKTNFYALLLEFLAPTKGAIKWLDWSDEELKFKNKNNLEIVYSALSDTDEEGRLQIKNGQDARKFIKALESSITKLEIERGVLLKDLSDLDFTEKALNSKIVAFKGYLETYADEVEITDSNFVELKKLHYLIDSLLGE